MRITRSLSFSKRQFNSHLSHLSFCHSSAPSPAGTSIFCHLLFVFSPVCVISLLHSSNPNSSPSFSHRCCGHLPSCRCPASPASALHGERRCCPGVSPMSSKIKTAVVHHYCSRPAPRSSSGRSCLAPLPRQFSSPLVLSPTINKIASPPRPATVAVRNC